MKSHSFFRVAFFFFFTILFFARVPVTFAAEDFDPTKSYTVHSLPVLSNQEQVSIHENERVSEMSVKLPTARSVVHQPSFWERVSTVIRDSLSNTGTSIQNQLHSGWQTIVSSVHSVSTSIYENRKWWLFGISFILSSSLIGYAIVASPFFFKILKKVIKNLSDLVIRLVGLVLAILFSVSSGVALTTVYRQHLDFFQQHTGWQLGPVGPELLLLGVILLLTVGFLEAGTIVVGIKSLAAAGVAALPGWKKVSAYFAKETKTAFTETEKECNDRIDKCSSLFDKMVILLFNYLPGNMPDLGMDDAIINFKNSLFASPQPANK